MTEVLNSPFVSYAVLLIVLLVLLVGHTKIHATVVRLELLANKFLPAPQAAAVDTVLNAVDTVATQPPQQSVADMLKVLDRLTELGVVNANVKTVTQAKAAGLFDSALQASVKQDVVTQVVQDLGSLKTSLEAHVGAVEPIIEKAVEDFVQEQKK